MLRFRKGGSGGEKPGRPDKATAMPLDALLLHLIVEVPRWESAEVDVDLLRARLADLCRDAGVAPAPADAVEQGIAGLDPEGLRRLALASSATDAPEVRSVVVVLLRDGNILEKIRQGFVEFARRTEILTLELLRQSSTRVEEFARLWLLGLGATVLRESAEESKLRLERLDYVRLLAEAEKAKREAEIRMEPLRKLQEEQAARRTRRGKF